MTKINRKKLVKGVKVQAQPVENLFSRIDEEVNGFTLDEENLQYKGNFDLTFNTRVLKNCTEENGYLPYSYRKIWSDPDLPLAGDSGSPSSYAIDYTTGTETNFEQENNLYQHFIFALPNTQEVFNFDGLTKDSYTYILNSITLSVEQLDNPAAPYLFPANNSGAELSLAGTDSYGIKVSLHKKLPWKQGDEIYWQEEVGTWEFPSSLFLNGSLSQNPFSFDNLKIKIFPDSIYLLSITTNNTSQTIELTGTDTWVIALNNLQINLNFSAPLLDYDQVNEAGEGQGSVQNAPSIEISDLAGTTTFIPIAADDVITEANFQGNLVLADKSVLRKLSGGFETDCAYQNRPAIKTSNVYEAKTIQMMNNNQLLYGWRKFYNGANYDVRAWRQGFDGSAMNLFPYSEYPPTPVFWSDYQPQRYLNRISDRKFFPIHEPFVIHHALFSYWVGHQDWVNRHLPTDAQDIFEVQIFMHTLNRSESALRHRIAYAKWQPIDCDDLITGESLVVDRSVYLQQQNSNLQRPQISSVGSASGFTVQIPINYAANPALTYARGTGYTTQGPPIFLGRATYPQSTISQDGNDHRTSIWKDVSNNTVVNYTKGQEQYLEVIFTIYTNGTNIMTDIGDEEGVAGYTTPTDLDKIKLQQPGAVLYLLGKKNLINTRDNQ